MSVKILSITLLLLSICVCCHSSEVPAHPGKRRPCCVDVTYMNKSAEVVGETYRQQAARPPCVKAIIFNTGNGGQLCADPNAQWVKHLTANMTKV
ncbi:eotaxin-like [Astatotilapia calliptera]|uniref:eotaxin-like n=1 Tax=Astatotilapia calliptera TaxID=8154 RepID=UPI000E40616C|nr:eotaxin-like [Astatotilapia calliptera]